MKNIVCKFGGTSLADAENIKKVAKIVWQNKAQFVVVSAPGKRFADDIKITDALIACVENHKAKKGYKKQFNFLKSRFEQIANALGVKIDFESHFNILKQKIEQNDEDFVKSRGEFLNALIFAEYVGYQFLDAADFVTFGDDGEVDMFSTKAKFEKIDKNKFYVIPGYYGACAGGKIKTFSRGGSDISGAVVCVCAGCKTYQNYTDVDGFFSADPKICPDAKLIEKMTYDEVRALSFAGANVLHPDCAKFLKDNNIVLNLRNTFNQTNKGTFVLPTIRSQLSNTPTAIASSGGHILFCTKCFGASNSTFCIDLLSKIFVNNGAKIHHYFVGLDEICILCNQTCLCEQKAKKIANQIEQQIFGAKVTVTFGVAVVSIVTKHFSNEIQKKVLSEIFSLEDEILFVSKCAGQCFVVAGLKTQDATKHTKILHKNLF